MANLSFSAALPKSSSNARSPSVLAKRWVIRSSSAGCRRLPRRLSGCSPDVDRAAKPIHRSRSPTFSQLRARRRCWSRPWAASTSWRRCRSWGKGWRRRWTRWRRYCGRGRSRRRSRSCGCRCWSCCRRSSSCRCWRWRERCRRCRVAVGRWRRRRGMSSCWCGCRRVSSCWSCCRRVSSCSRSSCCRAGRCCRSWRRCRRRAGCRRGSWRAPTRWRLDCNGHRRTCLEVADRRGPPRRDDVKLTAKGADIRRRSPAAAGPTR